jgi:hypothetical protein
VVRAGEITWVQMALVHTLLALNKKMSEIVTNSFENDSAFETKVNEVCVRITMMLARC